jgi:hypothetical protein
MCPFCQEKKREELRRTEMEELGFRLPELTEVSTLDDAYYRREVMKSRHRQLHLIGRMGPIPIGWE